MADAIQVRATGSHRVQGTSGPLSRTFASVWIHRMNETEAPPIVIMPDATIDLQWISGRLRIAGPDKDPQTEILQPGEIVIGLRFRPAAASAWLGIPLVELVDQRVAFDDISRRRARRVADRVRAEEGLEVLLDSLQDAVAGEGESGTTDTAMAAAYSLIERGAPAGAPLVPWLMRLLDMSERTLRRRFDQAFGYGPKTLDRILRYQRFLNLSSQSTTSDASLASEAGYADQAHLVRESRRLTGQTPGELRSLLERN